MTFTQKLAGALRHNSSCLCVGLDPDLARMPRSITQNSDTPDQQVLHFLRTVIDLTAEHCAGYKPNLGFFEALGAPGLHLFQQVIDYIPNDKIIIADAKRGDISTTAAHYATAYFRQFDVDAITLNPLMGFETLEPFLDYPEKGIYALTLTSNAGASDFLAKPFDGHSSMAEYIATTLAEYNEEHATDIGMVIGATQPENITPVIQHHPAGHLLIPGIGAQGGSIKKLYAALKNHPGIPLVNSSRSILYAGENEEDWEQAIFEKSLEFKTALQALTKRYV